MHPHVVSACAALYQRLARTQSFNQWETDRAEEALTELVNNPDRSDPPAHQIRNALSNASKKLRRRSEMDAYFFPNLQFGIDRAVPHDSVENALDIASVLSRMPRAERRLLELAASGAESDDIAVELGLPVQRVRERLSRARRRARTLWMGTSA